MPDQPARPLPTTLLSPHRPHGIRLFADWLETLLREALR